MSADGQNTSTEDNPYIIGDPAVDRYRLETQTRLYSDYIRTHAREFCADDIHSILDLGCGEGQLGFVLREVYPHARLVGIDRDAKAIAVAQSKAKALGGAGVEFIVGDITQALPDGPFDLVYASLIIEHMHDPEAVARAVYAQLKPQGYFWVKDIDPKIMSALEQPSYKRLGQMSLDTMVKLGTHPYVGDGLVDMLQRIGFNEVRREEEHYPLGGSSEIGRTTLALGLGAFYNARAIMSKIEGTPEADIERMYLEVINEATLNPGLAGELTLVNVVARRPPSSTR